MTEVLTQPLEAAHEYGKLVFLDKDGERAQQYPINKNLVVLGRDKACDIVITRREVSRHHAQLAVDDAGAVWLSSLGREPVSVNGKPATEAVELFTGDQIEIFLEGRVKILCFEAEDATIKINKGGPTPRKPLGDANQNTGALVPAAAAVKPSPASASRGRRTPAKRAAGTAGPAPPPPAPPLPPRGSLLPGSKPAGATSKIPKPPPLPKPADLRNGLKKGAAEESDHQAGQAATKTEAPQKMAVPSAPGTFLPSANELLALRAGLRKTGAAPPLEASESAVAAPAADSRDATAKKRKSVRFNIPAKEPRSPEGVPTDATVALDFGSPSSPDVIINVNADSTAAFSAWAMGSSGLSGGGRRSLGDTLTGGLPSILEEAPEDCAASPPPAMQVTPSREITPMLRRRSGRTSSITCSSPDSVGRKRRSCSGSRNGTPASKGAAPINADPEMAAAAAEEAALDASLAAAEAAAAGTGHTLEGNTVATLAAAAAQLQTAAEEAVSKEGTPRSDQQLPAGEAVEGTPSAGAPRMERLDSPATPWVPQIGVEAAAIAAALAASRSATPASAPGSPAAARATPGRRGRSSASGRKSRMSLAALAASPEDSPSANASAADVTEVLTQQFSAAKTGTKAPINTPVDVTGMPSFAALDMEGVAMRLAGIEAGRDSPSSPAVHSAPDANLAAPHPTFLSAGLGTHLVPHQTPLLVAPGAAAAAAEAAPAAVDVTMHQEMQADAADMTALKEELEAANIRAHAHQVRAQALEAQLAEMTALAVRLQQTSQELSARLQMLEQQAVAVQAPSIENKTQGMDTDKPALDAAAPMEEENAPTEEEPTEAAAVAMLIPLAATPAAGAAPAQNQPSAAKPMPQTTKTPTTTAGAVTRTPLTRSTAAKPGGQSAAGKTPGGAESIAPETADIAAGQTPVTRAMAQLPFEGLSQALSQGSLEWVDGLILPGGSQEAAAAGAGTPAHVPAPAEATAAPPTDVLSQGQDAAATAEPVAEMSLTPEDLTAEQAPVQDVQPAATPHEAPSADVDGAQAEEPVTDEVAALPSEEASGEVQDLAAEEEPEKAASEDMQLASEAAAEKPTAQEEPEQAASEDNTRPASEAVADCADPTESAEEASAGASPVSGAPAAPAEPAAATPETAVTEEGSGERLQAALLQAACAEAADAKAGSSKTSEEAAAETAEAETTLLWQAEEEEEEDTCHVCGEADEGDVLLLCDGCDNACHLGCARPMLRRVPKNDWFCSECKVARGAASKAAKRKAQTAEAKADAEEPQKPSKNPRRHAMSEPEQGAAAGDAKDAGTDAKSVAPEEAPARSGRSNRRSLIAVQPAQEAAPRPACGRRTSLAVAADNNPRNKAQASIAVPEAEAPGSAVTQACTTRRRASLAQTPATMPLAEASAAPRTAASTRGARRKSVSPALDAAPMQEAMELRSMGPAKRMTLASVEASLGPALGSLGVIEEADEEMGSDADEGESAPAAVPKKAPAPARAARGRKALEDKTNQEAPQPPARRIRAAAAGPASKKPRTAASPPKTRRSTRSRC